MSKQFPISKAALSEIFERSDLIDKILNQSIKREYEVKDNFLLETLKTKAFPRLIGKPNKYSFKWRFIKLEIHQQPSCFSKKWIVKQFGRKIAEMNYKLEI